MTNNKTMNTKTPKTMRFFAIARQNERHSFGLAQNDRLILSQPKPVMPSTANVQWTFERASAEERISQKGEQRTNEQ